MSRDTSDKTETTIKYLQKLRSAEPLTADESRELESLLTELQASGQQKATKGKQYLDLALWLYKRRDVFYAIWAFFFGG